MTKENEIPDQEYYRKRLQQRQKEILLENETGESGAATVDLDQTSVGRVSRVDALQAQAMSVAAQERRVADLQKIDAALKRVEEGEYGYCLNCGEAIAPQRLEINLAAALCVKCASALETQSG